MKKTTQQFIKEAKMIHGDKYDYSKVVYTGAMNKVCIICPVHGEFWQTPNKHLLGQGCVLCHRPVHDTESFIKKAKELYGDSYDYSKVKYINEKKKVKIICKIHGEFLVSPNNFLNGKVCPECRKENHKKSVSEKGLIHFLEKAEKIHYGKYDYSKVNYINAKTNVCIVCPEHGEFWQTPDSHLKGNGCPTCRESKLEKIVQKILENNSIQFIKQYTPDFFKEKKSFSYQKCDFYVPTANTVIECQGGQHFKIVKNLDNEDSLKRRIALDVRKKKSLDDHGIKVLYVINKSTSIKDIVDNSSYENIYNNENCIKENGSLETNILLNLMDKNGWQKEI